MRRTTFTFVVVFALTVLFIGPLWALDSEAGRSETKCKLQGAGFTPMLPDFGGWMMTFNGTGDNRGTTDWEFPLEDDPFYPDGTWTIGRGVWVKSGPNLYSYTFQVYFLDDYGALVYKGLNKGNLTMTSCDTGVLNGVLKLYDSNGNWVWHPDGIPYGPIPVQRLSLDQEFPIP